MFSLVMRSSYSVTRLTVAHSFHLVMCSFYLVLQYFYVIIFSLQVDSNSLNNLSIIKGFH